MKIFKLLCIVATMIVPTHAYAESIRYNYDQYDCALLGGPNTIFMYFDESSFFVAQSMVQPNCEGSEFSFNEEYEDYAFQDDQIRDFPYLSNDILYDFHDPYFIFNYWTNQWEEFGFGYEY